MNTPNYYLLLGGIASFLITLLHILLAIRPQIWRYFGAAELTQMHEGGSPFPVLVSVGLALMFAAWGAYAFSGVGVIGSLPLLKAILITIGIIYILRGLMLPSEVIELFRTGHTFRYIIMSTGCLIVGLLHLLGSMAPSSV